MITIGADPEVFLANQAGNPVSSIGKIGGTKYAPIPIEDGICLQEDNVTVEYNIPPCKTRDDFIKYNSRALEIIAEKAIKLDLNVLIKAAVRMPAAELKDPRSWVFGCEPDFNVWEMEYNPKPNPHQYRAAGGHVHIGCDLNNMQKVTLTKLLDVTLGALFSVIDDDVKRKSMYGAAGSIRLKPYGIEYRTLSNVWLRDKVFMKVVYDTSRAAAAYVQEQAIKNKNIDVPLQKGMLLAINKRKVGHVIELLRMTTHNNRMWLPRSFKDLFTKVLQAYVGHNNLDLLLLYTLLDDPLTPKEEDIQTPFSKNDKMIADIMAGIPVPGLKIFLDEHA
jgi:hypothetical protein